MTLEEHMKQFEVWIQTKYEKLVILNFKVVEDYKKKIFTDNRKQQNFSNRNVKEKKYSEIVSHMYGVSYFPCKRGISTYVILYICFSVFETFFRPVWERSGRSMGANPQHHRHHLMKLNRNNCDLNKQFVEAV